MCHAVVPNYVAAWWVPGHLHTMWYTTISSFAPKYGYRLHPAQHDSQLNHSLAATPHEYVGNKEKRCCMGNKRQPTDLNTRRFTWRISSSLSEGGTDGRSNAKMKRGRFHSEEGAGRSRGGGRCMIHRVGKDPYKCHIRKYRLLVLRASQFPIPRI